MSKSDSKKATINSASKLTGVTEAELTILIANSSLKAVGRDQQGHPLYVISELKALSAHLKRAKIYAALQGAPDLGPQASERSTILASLPFFARKLINADYAALTVMDSAGRIAEMYVSGMSQEQADGLGHPPVGRGVLGMMGPGGAPIRLHDIAEHPRSVGFPTGHPEMKSLLGVAIENGDRHAANLYVANSPGRNFTPEDQNVIEMLTEHGRTALEVEKLRQYESGLRIEAESARESAQAAMETADTIVQVATVGVMVADVRSMTIRRANEEIGRILDIELLPGTELGEIFDRTQLHDSRGRALSVEERPLNRVIVSGRPQNPVEILVTSATGVDRPVLSSAAPIMDSSGKLDAVVVVMQDASVLHEVEQAKRDFLSMVTHDLRTPITTVKALLQDARSPQEDEESSSAALESIEEEVDYLNELVGNLLDMSRIDANQDLFEYELCHILDLVSDAVQRARRSQRGKERTISTDIPSDLPLIYADPSQIGRVLDNFLSNALKYSDEDINVSCLLKEDGHLVTKVQDSGRGVPAGMADSVFDRFFRVHHGRQANREGSGLGLAVSKAIVQAHNGLIGVNSVEGQGSTFWFSLPAED